MARHWVPEPKSQVVKTLPTHVDSATPNAFALRAWWQPKEAGWVPSITLGYDYTGFNHNDKYSDNQVSKAVKGTRFLGEASKLYRKQSSQAWTVGLNWKDAFMKGKPAWLRNRPASV